MVYCVVQFKDGKYGLRCQIDGKYLFYTRRFGPHVRETEKPEQAERFSDLRFALEEAEKINERQRCEEERKTDYGTPIDG